MYVKPKATYKKAKTSGKGDHNKEVKVYLQEMNTNLWKATDMLMEIQDDEDSVRTLIMKIVNGSLDRKFQQIKEEKLIKKAGLEEMF